MWTEEMTQTLAMKIVERYDEDYEVNMVDDYIEIDGLTVVVSANVHGWWKHEKETNSVTKEYVVAHVNINDVYDENYKSVDIDVEWLEREVEQLIEAV